MRWLWRLAVVLLLIFLIDNLNNDTEHAFIKWSFKTDMISKVQWNIEQFRKKAQDLPMTIELEIHKMWQEYRPSGGAKQI